MTMRMRRHGSDATNFHSSPFAPLSWCWRGSFVHPLIDCTLAQFSATIPIQLFKQSITSSYRSLLKEATHEREKTTGSRALGRNNRGLDRSGVANYGIGCLAHQHRWFERSGGEPSGLDRRA